ncbi:hypothetical protein [Streptomyces sp. SP18CS02]|uniref:hypothetical protein n=1 Tax=Streptomyces sp. SP18CS02 TaxID=3002531 RepID=UPI002E7673A6|nr:hypothetical protein [Streptomyces sp. SP18CS02]MEE1751538.1 hypothetical protein [Streptomyces sp. SP18CS02]
MRKVELFSPEFASDIWGKRAAELSPAGVRFAEEDLRTALVEYRDNGAKLRALNKDSEAVTAIDGVRTGTPVHAFHLDPADDTLDDYAQRVDKYVEGREWSIAYFGLYAAGSAMWDAAKSFSDALARALGHRPGGRVDIDCFIGRYSSTHTGVHVDHAHNFASTLRDGKTMYAWPGDRQDLLGLKSPHYDRHKDEGVALRNAADRIAYFPQDHLHVAETKDEVSVNVNVTFWERGDDTRSHADWIRSVLRQPARTSHDVRRPGAAAPTSDNRLLLQTLRALGTDGSLERRMAVAQLIMDTSGRLNVPRPVQEKPAVAELVTLTPVTTLQWYVMDGLEEMLVAANGHCASFPYRKDVEGFLETLSSGAPADLSWLAEPGQREKRPDFSRTVVALARWGAL